MSDQSGTVGDLARFRAPSSTGAQEAHTAPSATEEELEMQAITTDTHPLSAASTSRDQLGGSSVARPAPALLPSDVPPPPHRPFNRDEALMDDALRSLPPAQQRGIMRRRAGSSASQPQLDLDLALSRTRTRNTEASDRSTHSAAGWRSWLAKRSSIAGPSSVRSVRRDSAETDHGVGQDGSSHQRRAHHARSKAARREERRARRESRRAQALAAQVNAEEHPSEQMATDPPVVEASAAPSPKLSVRLPAEPPGLLPTALAKPSKLRKPRQRLQFAPEQRKVRREYLPEDYEAGDDYRGFDEFVEAARSRRRRERRQALGDPRRRKGSRSSKSSRSSVASSDGNSSDSSSSPSSSSGSSASGHGLSMARLRAWFGDSSSSDSSSSSSSTSSDSSSDSSSPSSDGARSRISRSRSRISGRGGRARRRRSASRHRSEMGEYARPDSPTVFGLRAASSFGPLSEYAMKGGAKRHRRRKAVRRARQRELRLIEQGIITPGMSMSNRAKAAQEASGRVSEFTLFTPVALPLTPVEAQAARPSLGRRGMTNQRVPLKEQSGDDVLQGTLSGKVLRTTAFAEVKSRLLTLQQFGRQLDRQDGDLGVANEKPVDHAERDATEAHGAHVTPVRRDAGYHSEMRPELASRRSVSAQDPHPEWEDELDVGDLALPPPALDLRVPDKDKPDELFSPGHHDDEGATGLHMSDVPLSPQMRHHFRADLFRLTPRRPFASPRPSHHSHHSYHSGPKSPGGERTRAESEASCIAPSATDPEHVSEQTEEGDIAVDTQEVPDRGSSEDATKVGLASVPESPPATGAGTWWLDVSCPTYRDMRELSKMFPLHPLTVEDVLQQEPREKVDVFERLGYYFVVTRAIDERYFRYTSGSASGSSKSLASDAEGVDEEKHVNVDVLEKGAKEDSFEMREFGSEKSGTNVTIGGGAGAGIADGRALDSGTQKPNGRARVDIIEGVGGKEGLEGVSVGAINVYLIVFAHGVISFHFEDIAKHTDKVRRRLLDVSQPVELTSDWIAHGILDSIVDAFFPLISYVEIEVEEIEQSANEPLPMWRSKKRGKKASDEDSHGEIVSVATVQDGDPVDTESLPTIMFEVKRRRMRPVLRPLPRVPLARGVARLLPRFMVAERQVTSVKRQSADPSLSPNFFTPNRVDTGALNPGDRAFESQAALDQGAMLMRITAMRKIVTGLSRLLVPKNDFVRGLRKRLVDANAAWIGDGGTAMSRTEVSIYMGDVHDHIVTMLQNLRNGDTRLTDIHASYLAQVNHNDRKVKQGTDKVLVVLATVTVTALSSQCFTSLWGINAHTPRNVHGSHTFTYFFIVVAGVVFIISAILTFVYVITKRAKRKTELRRAAR